ncbi:hypothetical protein HBI54_222520 [Parastagonospora nodorum]|nr:hypothetical protein HBI54_222520 [Parastagonospora nodorum]
MACAFLKTANTTFPGYDIIDNQINTLKERLNDTITSEDAAKRLASHPEASSTPVELQQRLSGLWALLNETAVKDEAAQPKIISILQAIRQLPKAKVPTGEGEDVMDFDDGYYWRELTGWANDWADAFNAHASSYLIDHPDDDQRKAAWTNGCAYTARLAVTGDESLSSYGAGLDRATSAISEVLEVDTSGEEPKGLEAAAQLFNHASPELYRRCRDGPAEGMLTNRDSTWKGQDGYSDARWRFWFERWTAVAEKDGFSQRARELAMQAWNAMKVAEYGWLQYTCTTRTVR